MIALKKLAELVGGTLFGNPELPIEGVSVIQNGKPGTITFLANPKYGKYADHTQASALITSKESLLKNRDGILVSNPQLAMAKILNEFAPKLNIPSGIHSTAVISRDALLGKNVSIGPFAVVEPGAQISDNAIIGSHCIIGHNTHIGPHTILDANIHIYHGCEVGNNCRFQSGTVIGSDGYGYVTEGDQHHKIPQNGNVLVGNNVEMGANCTIDRGTIGDTVIGDGCKLDNNVHIAHNVTLGKGCLLTAHVTIAGSSQIGEFCVFGGQSGVSDHVTIGEKAMFAAKSGITKSLPGNKIYSGMPAREIRETNKRDAAYAQIQLFKKRLSLLENTLK